MPSAEHLLAFAVTGFVVIVIPGPSVLFVVGRALSSGRRVALLSMVGNSFGVYVQTVAVAFGIGALVEESVAAFTAVKLLGGCYLLYLGFKTFRARKSTAGAISASFGAPRSDRRAFVEGMTVGVTNPKTIVFLVAVLPQFTSRNDGSVPIQILILGAIFFALAMVSDSVWIAAASTVRSWFAGSPRRLELVGGTGGLAIMAVGAGVLATGRKT
ncbi:MAG TPA: LysE family translocator [Mycobacteriales bacterium]|jgi:threonine/homoserine/homoserine lactone efflux protein|nr:LysE family translocator [Mycobacteriales bacterium]